MLGGLGGTRDQGSNKSAACLLAVGAPSQLGPEEPPIMMLLLYLRFIRATCIFWLRQSTPRPRKTLDFRMMRTLLTLLPLWPGLAADVCVDESCKDERTAHEMLFIHIPYNFGYTVGVAALFGHNVTSTWSVPEAWRRSEEPPVAVSREF